MTSVLCVRSSTGLYGAEGVLLDLIPALQNCRVAASLACIEDYVTDNRALYDAAVDRRIDAFVVPCRSRFDRSTIRGLRRHIVENQIEVVQSNDPKSTVFSLLATRGLQVPIVATLHGWVDTTWRLRIYNRVEATLLKLCTAVVVVADQMLERVTRAGVDRKKVAVIGNGVDTERFAPQESSAAGLTLLTVARLTPEKGIDVLIRAFAAASAEVQGLRLRIAGAGPLRGELEALARQQGVSESIEFLGFVSSPEKLYADATCYVCASYTEGMPLSVLEAMASGLPIIATAVGSLPDIVGGCRVGCLVPPGDAERLAAAITEQAGSPELRAEQGRRSARCARERYSLATQAGAYARLFERARCRVEPATEAAQ